MITPVRLIPAIRRFQPLLHDCILNYQFWDGETSTRIEDVSPLRNHGVLENGTWLDGKPIIADYRNWADGQTGSIGKFVQYSSHNRRTNGDDPWGNTTPLWEVWTDTTGAYGGIYYTAVPIDNTKLYRMSFWERRVTNGDILTGKHYFGLNGYGATNGVYVRDTGGLTTNPYFRNLAHTSLPINVWTLWVGHVWPAGSGLGGRHPDSGIYKLTGYWTSITDDFVWHADTTTGRPRTLSIYQGDSTVNPALHQTVYPRIDICDGTEPTIEQLINGFDAHNKDYIGQFTRALKFNGTNTIITVPASQVYACSNMTLVFRIYPDNFDEWRGLIHIGEDDTSNYLCLRCNGSSLQLLVEDDNVGQVNVAATPIPELSKPQHIILTQDGSGWQYYLNGRKGVLTGINSAYCTDHLTVNNIRIGYSPWAESYYSGLMTKAQIYPWAFSAAEALEDAQKDARLVRYE